MEISEVLCLWNWQYIQKSQCWRTFCLLFSSMANTKREKCVLEDSFHKETVKILPWLE